MPFTGKFSKAILNFGTLHHKHEENIIIYECHINQVFPVLSTCIFMKYINFKVKNYSEIVF